MAKNGAYARLVRTQELQPWIRASCWTSAALWERTGLLLARVLDRAEQASERNIPAATDFFSPAQQAQAADLLHAAGIPETAYIRWGGYDGAERAVLLFLPDWMEPSDAGTYSPIRCLRAAFREEESLTHRDFLGSLMGMGIVREKIGDILVGPDSADVLVLDTVAEFLVQSWESAGRAKLRVAEIDPGCVHIPEVRRARSGGTRCPPCGWTPCAPPASAWPGARRRHLSKAAGCS